MSQAAQGFPAAPLSLEETAAMSVQADDPQQLHKAVWMRLSRRAAEVAGLSDGSSDGSVSGSVEFTQLVNDDLNETEDAFAGTLADFTHGGQ